MELESIRSLRVEVVGGFIGKKDLMVFNAESFKGLIIEVSTGEKWFWPRMRERSLSFIRSVSDFIKRCNVEADLKKHAEYNGYGTYTISNYDKTVTLSFSVKSDSLMNPSDKVKNAIL